MLKSILKINTITLSAKDLCHNDLLYKILKQIAEAHKPSLFMHRVIVSYYKSHKAFVNFHMRLTNNASSYNGAVFFNQTTAGETFWV